MVTKRKIALFNDTRRTSHYGCEFVMQRIAEELHSRDVEIAFSWPVGYDWRTAPNVMERLAGVDGVIVNGEGSIHTSATNERARYLTEVAQVVKSRYTIPVHLVNASLFNVGADIFENLRYFDQLFVRESHSQQLLAGQGIHGETVPDLTLTITVEGARVGAPANNILVTDSVISAVAKELKTVAAEKGWCFAKLTHASWPMRCDNWPAREYLRRCGKWLYASLVGRSTRNRFEFLQFLATRDLLCTGRFHGATLALAAGTPFVAIESNTQKTRCLLQDVFGTTGRLLDVSLIRRIGNGAEYAWSREEGEQIATYVASAKSRVTAMFDRICSTLSVTERR